MAEMILRTHRSRATGRRTPVVAATANPTATHALDTLPVPGRLRDQGAVCRSPVAADPLGGAEVTPDIAGTLDRLRGRGAPLSAELAGPLGAALGADLADVRIHADAQAHGLNRMLQARAFTHGRDIYFGAGSYAPHTAAGRHLLNHELAHVAQNRAGTGPVGPLTVGRADDPAEVEAEAVAHRIRRVTVGGGTSIRRAGDKIAFQEHKAAADGDQALITAIGQAIKAHQGAKRTFKTQIETAKDLKIGQIDVQEKKAVAAIQPGVADFQEERKKVQEPYRAGKVTALKEFHQSYQTSGWNLVRLRKEILEATKDQVTFGKEAGNEIPVVSVASGNKLYSILKGQSRFDASGVKIDGKDPTNPVFTKKGTTKEYIQDARKLFIGRYVYRGCSQEQMEELFRTGAMRPRNPTDIIGNQIGTYDFGKRTKDEKLTMEEREFLQQRDGSGADQRMLSVSHAKPGRKVHSNHGEVFTNTATIKIDMARMDAKLIYDVHLEESHQYKTALARKDRGKSLQEERTLYVYSAEKNRETLLLAIPRDAVVGVANPTEITLDSAHRFYDPVYNKQELERERQERLAQLEKERKAAEAQRREREEKEKAERKQAEAEKKQSTQQAEEKRRDSVIAALREIYNNNPKKFRQQKTAWDKFDDDPEDYLIAFEKKKKLVPNLVMMGDLTELLKSIK